MTLQSLVRRKLCWFASVLFESFHTVLRENIFLPDMYKCQNKKFATRELLKSDYCQSISERVLKRRTCKRADGTFK